MRRWRLCARRRSLAALLRGSRLCNEVLCFLFTFTYTRNEFNVFQLCLVVCSQTCKRNTFLFSSYSSFLTFFLFKHWVLTSLLWKRNLLFRFFYHSLSQETQNFSCLVFVSCCLWRRCFFFVQTYRGLSKTWIPPYAVLYLLGKLRNVFGFYFIPLGFTFLLTSPIVIPFSYKQWIIMKSFVK